MNLYFCVIRGFTEQWGGRWLLTYEVEHNHHWWNSERMYLLVAYCLSIWGRASVLLHCISLIVIIWTICGVRCYHDACHPRIASIRSQGHYVNQVKGFAACRWAHISCRVPRSVSKCAQERHAGDVQGSGIFVPREGFIVWHSMSTSHSQLILAPRWHSFPYMRWP